MVGSKDVVILICICIISYYYLTYFPPYLVTGHVYNGHPTGDSNLPLDGTNKLAGESLSDCIAMAPPGTVAAIFRNDKHPDPAYRNTCGYYTDIRANGNRQQNEKAFVAGDSHLTACVDPTKRWKMCGL